ncbi:tetraspanin-8-like isoform X2 [Gambusia affinis]|uniref:tetraspanin-8-like isoform X2 n=1 Tax=Gambusia affinis TaxID=33528 RepID=UPI001CDC9A2C|nr:tetraspanin-8-like isoform X2 [Gambusia affinis]
MQKSSVVVVADKTSLKRPFIFANAVHMALCFFMLRMTVIWHRDLIQTGKMVPSISVAMMYVIEVGCLLLSVLGVFGACKGKRWCLILYATGMAVASQTIIIRTALSYQDVYEKRVVREESKLLAMMPLTAPNKANRTLLHNIQEELECCGLIEGYKDWGASIPASCNCHYPGKCVRLRGSATIGAPKNQYVYREPCLPIYLSELKLAFSLEMAIQFGSGVFWVKLFFFLYHIYIQLPLPCFAFSSLNLTHRFLAFCVCPQLILLAMSIKLMGQIKRKQEFIALLQSNRYVPGAF